jgi:hypothetical protein
MELKETSMFFPLYQTTEQNTGASSNMVISNLVERQELSHSNPNEAEIVSVEKEEHLSLAERDNLLQSFVRMSLETNFEQNVWLVKRNYWAYASRRLGKHFITTRLSHWIFEYIAEERLKYDQKQNMPTDLDKCRKWVTDYVKVKNTHHKVPIFRYIQMVQPKTRESGGEGWTETVMRVLNLSIPDSLYWQLEDIEKQAAEDREIEIYNQKQRTLMKQNTKDNEDGEESTPKRKRSKRKTENEDDLTPKRKARPRKSKEDLSKDDPSQMGIPTMSDIPGQNFPPFEVWEDEESYLVALQVPAIDRSSLEHKISIVGLDVNGSCSLPMNITKRWPGAFDWYPRKWNRQIIFPKPIDPGNSGLVDIQCEGMLFYKCPKQSIQSVSLTNTIKLPESHH